MNFWARPKKEQHDLSKEPTYKLLRMSTKICRNCTKYRSADCPMAPAYDSPEYDNFVWSSLSACDNWTPCENVCKALQVLTIRKIEGQDIEYRT